MDVTRIRDMNYIRLCSHTLTFYDYKLLSRSDVIQVAVHKAKAEREVKEK